MKYIWIVMIAIVYLYWLICSLIDIVATVKELRAQNKKYDYSFNEWVEEFFSLIDDSTGAFIGMTIFVVFLGSLIMFCFGGAE